MMRWLAVFLLVASAPFAAQVTAAPQAADVRPGDPAFQTMQRLIERYGCIAGYPARSFRGNRAITRFEFAAGINACAGTVKNRVASEEAVDTQDLADLAALEREFADELAVSRDRVDTLEARTTALEAAQFSKTSKLGGETIFAEGGTTGQAQPRKKQIKRQPRVPPTQPAQP